jgi:small GTP-binding protein
VQNQFVETWDPTIEDSYNKQIKLTHNGVEHNIMLNILDTAGQEEYKALRDEYMRAADAFLMVFDVTNQKTFSELEQFRTQIQRSKDVDYPPCVIVGNKSDLPEDLKVVSKKDAESLSSKWKIKYIEASAKTRKNIDESFHQLVHEILASRESKDVKPSPTPQKEATPAKKGCLLL